MLRLPFTVSCLLMVACASRQAPAPVNASGPVASTSCDVECQRETDVLEAVFRHQFERNEAGLGKDAAAYFLEVCERDPSPPLLERFASHQPPVKARSQADVSAYEGVTDRASGKKGLLFRVTSVQWLAPDRAQVKGGYFEGGLSASGNTYVVGLSEGRWQVLEQTRDWISLL